jgi:hypothetical protein
MDLAVYAERMGLLPKGPASPLRARPTPCKARFQSKEGFSLDIGMPGISAMA